jgi:uncharacterized protein
VSRARASRRANPRRHLEPKEASERRPKRSASVSSVTVGRQKDGSANPAVALLAAAAKGPRLAGKGLIRLYRYTLSSVMGRECRHLPTCSEYGEEAIERHGLWAGGWMTLARVVRCHPWGTSGLDFVPEEKPRGAHWYVPWRYGLWRGVNEHAGGARRGRRRVRAL